MSKRLYYLFKTLLNYSWTFSLGLTLYSRLLLILQPNTIAKFANAYWKHSSAPPTMWLVVGQCWNIANCMTKQDFIFFIVLMFDTRIHLKFLIIVYDRQYIDVIETKATQLGKEHSLMSKQGVAFTAICFDQDWRIQKTYCLLHVLFKALALSCNF